jgi:hypothetical protein
MCNDSAELVEALLQENHEKLVDENGRALSASLPLVITTKFLNTGESSGRETAHTLLSLLRAMARGQPRDEVLRPIASQVALVEYVRRYCTSGTEREKRVAKECAERIDSIMSAWKEPGNLRHTKKRK